MIISRKTSLRLLLLTCALHGCGGGDSSSSAANPPTSNTPAPTAPAPAPASDTQPPTVDVSVLSAQRVVDSGSALGHVDTVSLEIDAADNVGVLRLTETVNGSSLADGSPVASATYDEAPVKQPSGLSTIDTTIFPIGVYSVVLRAIDAAGNSTDSTPVKFYVCKNGPSTILCN